MNPPNLFQKLAIAGVSTAIAATTIAAAPADAQEYSGGIGFSDNTTDFIDQLDPVFDSDGPFGDEFVVTFSDVEQVVLNSTNGDFVTWLGDYPPIGIEPIDPVTITFSQTGINDPIEEEAIYTTQNDGVWDFSGLLLPTAGINTLEFVLKTGSDFVLDELTYVPGVEAEFSLCNTCLHQGVWLVDGEEVAATSVFQFEDLAGVDGGEYEVQSVIKTPEPSAMVGLLALSGLGLGMKRKKEQK